DFKYQCCGEDRQNNKSETLCNLSVKESKLLLIFNKTLGVVFTVVLLYWPWFLCSSSNMVDKDDFDKRRIPIDDFSPITITTIVQTFAEKLSALRHGDNVKMFILWYCVILYLLIKGSPFDNASEKLLFQVINSYLYVFDLDRPLVYVLFIFPFFVIPGIFLMLRNIVFIVVFLIVASTAILLFKVVHNSSVIMSSVAVFLSGKLSETFFIGVTADYSFIGWEKICLEKKIARAIIKEYMKEPTEKIPRSLDICRLPTHFA
ncbi:hypothetical protein P5673_028124, partial [Acropora cervicornis]